MPENRCYIVLVNSTEGGIKGGEKKGGNLNLGAISHHAFLMFIPPFVN